MLELVQYLQHSNTWPGLLFPDGWLCRLDNRVSSFTTGAATYAVLITQTSISPVIALAGLAGSGAGICTARLHIKGHIIRLLSGIIMMTILYSVNLQIMGKGNLQLVNNVTIFDAAPMGLRPVFLVLLALAIYATAFLLLKTHGGYLLRTCGENSSVVKKIGYRAGGFVILGLVILNALTSFSGAIAAQYYGYSDVEMGTELIVVVFAALIVSPSVRLNLFSGYWRRRLSVPFCIA